MRRENLPEIAFQFIEVEEDKNGNIIHLFIRKNSYEEWYEYDENGNYKHYKNSDGLEIDCICNDHGDPVYIKSSDQPSPTIYSYNYEKHEYTMIRRNRSNLNKIDMFTTNYEKMLRRLYPSYRSHFYENKYHRVNVIKDDFGRVVKEELINRGTNKIINYIEYSYIGETNKLKSDYTRSDDLITYYSYGPNGVCIYIKDVWHSKGIVEEKHYMSFIFHNYEHVLPIFIVKNGKVSEIFKHIDNVERTNYNEDLGTYIESNANELIQSNDKF